MGTTITIRTTGQFINAFVLLENLFVGGPHLFKDLVCLETLFVWVRGLHLFEDLICQETSLVQEPWCFSDAIFPRV